MLPSFFTCFGQAADEFVFDKIEAIFFLRFFFYFGVNCILAT